MSRSVQQACLRALIVVMTLALLVVPGPAAAQTLSMDPAAPAASPPVEPLPFATTPPPATPRAGTMPPPAVAPAVAPVPAVAVAPPPADPPIVERWWFWTAIGAIAVTAVVILATQSGPSTPRTDLGNMPAF